MTASSWLTWVALDWACLIAGPLLDDIGRAIGRLAVGLQQAARLRRERRERFAQLQYEFALARLQHGPWPASASRGLAQHVARDRLRLGPP